ncbi:MAG: HDOD domain-containing protein [Planctomycetaceae bacterium]|jgi:HD-like signal output (HDOD) protein|nr:HDOD domain-containing protein [Phycisphaerales bacterium]MCE2654592.1 HDOD domain-containing protein [Planctomycetaceae bacterium]
MAVDVAKRDAVVAAAIREISHIATLPEITLKIIQLVEDPASTAQDLHNVIAKDPALCTRILKVVNSAFYGLPGQIGSINRAIVLLGLNAVKNIAIAASLAKLFKGGHLSPNFSARDLWIHSVGVAAATKLQADHLKLGLADESFLGGLIHDVGLMVMLQFDRNKLIDTVERVAAAGPGTDMLAIENETFNANHQDFGAALCDKWKFPRSFIHVCGFHHRPLDLPPEHRTIASMVYISDRLVAELKAGFRLDVPYLEIPQDVLDQLKLSRKSIDDIRAKLPEQIDAVCDMLA